MGGWAQRPRSSRGSLVPRGLGRFGSVGGNGNDLLGADARVRGEQLGCDRLDIRSLDLGDCPEVDEDSNIRGPLMSQIGRAS